MYGGNPETEGYQGPEEDAWEPGRQIDWKHVFFASGTWYDPESYENRETALRRAVMHGRNQCNVLMEVQGHCRTYMGKTGTAAPKYPAKGAKYTEAEAWGIATRGHACHCTAGWTFNSKRMGLTAIWFTEEAWGAFAWKPVRPLKGD